MNPTAILSVLVAVVATAVATTAVADDSNNANANSIIQGLPLNYTLAPNAVELLQPHGLWAPDPAAFAAGVPNVNHVNLTAEVERFKESGLDANEIVTVSIDNAAAAAAAVVGPLPLGHGSEYQYQYQYRDCEQCDGCQVDCIVLVIFLPFYGA